eukprot:766616-Hanusia_phi.AAC.2
MSCFVVETLLLLILRPLTLLFSLSLSPVPANLFLSLALSLACFATSDFPPRLFLFSSAPQQLHMSMYNPTVAVPRAAREASRRSVSTIGHYERSEQDHDDSERNLVVDWRGSPAQGDEDGGQAGGAFLTDLPEMQGDLPGGDAREGVWKTNFFVLGFMTEVLRNLGKRAQEEAQLALSLTRRARDQAETRQAGLLVRCS